MKACNGNQYSSQIITSMTPIKFNSSLSMKNSSTQVKLMWDRSSENEINVAQTPCENCCEWYFLFENLMKVR